MNSQGNNAYRNLILSTYRDTMGFFNFLKSSFKYFMFRLIFTRPLFTYLKRTFHLGQKCV